MFWLAAAAAAAAPLAASTPDWVVRASRETVSPGLLAARLAPWIGGCLAASRLESLTESAAAVIQ